MYQKIMAPLDGSKLAECVLPHVKTLVKTNKSAEVLLVQAVEPLSIPYGRGAAAVASMEQLQAFEAHHRVDAEKYLSKVAVRLKKAGIKASAEVIYGRAAEVLGDFAEKHKVDLVVIATHGRSGVSRWMWGSVADRLLRSLCVPVLMVRAPGCVPGV